jgi:hypothetical protein
VWSDCTRSLRSSCVRTSVSHYRNALVLNLRKRVADTLLTRGRLGLGQIIRFTQLRPRTARACILVLVQHNVLWHATIPDEGEVLEFNVEECLTRLRYGRYVHTAQTLFGDAVRVSGLNYVFFTDEW